MELIAQLPIDVDGSATDMAGLVAAGRRHRLSPYDASYLVLAERQGVALATLDRPLAKAAGNSGVQLITKP